MQRRWEAGRPSLPGKLAVGPISFCTGWTSLQLEGTEDAGRVLILRPTYLIVSESWNSQRRKNAARRPPTTQPPAAPSPTAEGTQLRDVTAGIDCLERNSPILVGRMRYQDERAPSMIPTARKEPPLDHLPSLSWARPINPKNAGMAASATSSTEARERPNLDGAVAAEA